MPGELTRRSARAARDPIRGRAPDVMANRLADSGIWQGRRRQGCRMRGVPVRRSREVRTAGAGTKPLGQGRTVPAGRTTRERPANKPTRNRGFFLPGPDPKNVAPEGPTPGRRSPVLRLVVRTGSPGRTLPTAARPARRDPRRAAGDGPGGALENALLVSGRWALAIGGNRRSFFGHQVGYFDTPRILWRGPHGPRHRRGGGARANLPPG